ncbi:peptide ABC transporter permease [Rhodanobacter sp. FW510-R12]|uniref:ABC transporter permease n=1 Tax=unclassified Rhodanobacter TaxID=2621553 RepID=UPI0007A9AEC1|nr:MULTISPECIES: FtsX-like permease family protein [unclassified Rhodanobacter]KZC17673.1 peptide ABC transporter permease [Rhodanobacter sp. FW104-R8]KZC25846.1 peptide ABC transporter permease [Rhodanobacter sp. FW510-T8]KZC33276.1 peptide ABC transporter permease [Rhodanobacter sp. FW510-R10]
MFAYYLDLALRSFRRSKALTALVVVLMGCGVATCMVAFAVFRAAAADPIPWKSNQLFVPQIDNFGPVHNWKGQPPILLSYNDAEALLHARQARRQVLIYGSKWTVLPDDARQQPFPQEGDAVSSDFFAMFDARFRYGGGWSANDDDQRAAVAVISSALNRKLFGGDDSVGREINLDAHVYRIVGVLDDWDPRPRFFDVTSTFDAFGHPRQIYLPFSRAIDLQKAASGQFYCSTNTVDPHLPDWSSILHSECAWIVAWVELPTRADVAHYHDWLRNYAAEQRRLGRLDWPPNVRLSNVMQWLHQDGFNVIPKSSALSLIVSVSFLLICLVNVVGLMLARFMRRAPEIGVRRALGASRGAIYRQFLVEAAAIGLAGGVLGVLLTALGMAGIGKVFEPEIARLARLDASLFLLAVLVAVAATLIAALYPTWRAAQVQPAWQLKSNG